MRGGGDFQTLRVAESTFWCGLAAPVALGQLWVAGRLHKFHTLPHVPLAKQRFGMEQTASKTWAESLSVRRPAGAIWTGIAEIVYCQCSCAQDFSEWSMVYDNVSKSASNRKPA